MEAGAVQGPPKRPKASNSVPCGAGVLEPALGSPCVKSAGGGAREDGEVGVPALGSTLVEHQYAACSQEPGESPSMLPSSMRG